MSGMKRLLQYVLVIALCFVALNYVFLNAKLALGSLIGSPAQGGIMGRPDTYDGLATVNFAFFHKGGVGWSYITQGYGRTPFAIEYPGDWHDGVDIAAAYGASLYPVTGGVVLATGNQDNFCFRRGFGKYVAIKNGDGRYVTWYAHLGAINVSPGDAVSPSTVIGTIGNTGLETGPHLHFSIFDADTFTMTPRNGCGPEPTGKDEDPIPYLQGL